MRGGDTAIWGSLVAQWNEVRSTLERLRGSAQVRPADGWSIFRPVDIESDLAARFIINPICFKVPERATHADMDLIVAATGFVDIRRDRYKSEGILMTEDFATRVAYFRLIQAGAVHVYGAHYDFSLNQLGHPIFHSQIRSYAELWSSVESEFDLGMTVTDSVKGMLQTVRVPTAQLDVFSVFIQVLADHVLEEENRDDFNALIEKSSVIKGAAFQAPRLAEPAAYSCYRASHWFAP